MATGDPLKAPFPWFGGKSRVAKLVWDRLGDVDNAIEPFAGSAAFLLARPHPPHVETLNDADTMVANFWRATSRAPELVAEAADWPVNEADLHARHRWLVLSEEARAFRQRMRTDPDYFDPKIAGWWCWGLCQWIGSGWCDASQIERNEGATPTLAGSGGTGQGVHAKGLRRKRPKAARANGNNTGGTFNGVHGRPQLADAYSRGRGVHNDNHLSQQLPCIGTGGHGDGTCGIHKTTGGGTCAQRRAWLLDWFNRLRDRLRTVRVCCGDWTRVCSSESVTVRLGTTGVFMDPPYSAESGRDKNLYSTDCLQVAHQVRRWCLEWGTHPQMRIALCGYAGEGHEELEALGWQVVAWKAQGGYGNRTEQGKENAARERIWFSPACINQKGLFDSLEDA